MWRSVSPACRTETANLSCMAAFLCRALDAALCPFNSSEAKFTLRCSFLRCLMHSCVQHLTGEQILGTHGRHHLFNRSCSCLLHKITCGCGVTILALTDSLQSTAAKLLATSTTETTVNTASLGGNVPCSIPIAASSKLCSETDPVVITSPAKWCSWPCCVSIADRFQEIQKPRSFFHTLSARHVCPQCFNAVTTISVQLIVAGMCLGLRCAHACPTPDLKRFLREPPINIDQACRYTWPRQN